MSEDKKDFQSEDWEHFQSKDWELWVYPAVKQNKEGDWVKQGYWMISDGADLQLSGLEDAKGLLDILGEAIRWAEENPEKVKQ